MKLNKTIVASAMLVAMCGAASAAPPSWQGTFFVTDVSSGCSQSNDVVGEYGLILYRPILNPKDPAEGISFFFGRSVMNIISENGSFRGITGYSGLYTGRSVKPDQFNGSTHLTVTPANVSSGTEQILISGKVNTWFDTQSCNVTINATLLPRL